LAVRCLATCVTMTKSEHMNDDDFFSDDDYNNKKNNNYYYRY